MPYKDPNKQKEYNRLWRTNRRFKWIQEHGPCVICGSWDNLEIDHIDPATKNLPISIIWSWAEDIRKAELEKCQVLCHTCHLNKTKEERNVFVCGTENGYSHYNCRCSNCREAHKIYRAIIRYTTGQSSRYI